MHELLGSPMMRFTSIMSQYQPQGYGQPGPQPQQDPYAAQPQGGYTPQQGNPYQGYPQHYAAVPMQQFSFNGGAGDYFVVSLLAYVLTAFTLGLGGSWAMCELWKWETEHTTYQGRRMQFNGTGGDLFGEWFLGGLLCIVTCGIYSFWFYPKLYKYRWEHTVIL